MENNDTLVMAKNILNVPPNASRNDIDRLYAERVMKCRPDINGKVYTTEYKAVQAAYNTIIASMKPAKNKSSATNEVYVDSPQFKIPKREEIRYKADVFRSVERFDPKAFNVIFERSKAATQERLGGAVAPTRVKSMETSSYMSGMTRLKEHNGELQWCQSKDPRCMKVEDFEREANNTVILTDRDVSKKEIKRHWSQLDRDMERLSIRDLQSKANDQLRLR